MADPKAKAGHTLMEARHAQPCAHNFPNGRAEGCWECTQKLLAKILAERDSFKTQGDELLKTLRELVDQIELAGEAAVYSAYDEARAAIEKAEQ